MGTTNPSSFPDDEASEARGKAAPPGSLLRLRRPSIRSDPALARRIRQGATRDDTGFSMPGPRRAAEGAAVAQTNPRSVPQPGNRCPETPAGLLNPTMPQRSWAMRADRRVPRAPGNQLAISRTKTRISDGVTGGPNWLKTGASAASRPSASVTRALF